MSDAFAFHVTHCVGAARRGELATPHGVVQTPAFMPVGTRGSVKAVTHRDLQDVGAEIILANTYHLYLRPGDGLIARCGGLHRFIGWSRPILTDSGGYQVFSLGRQGSLRTIDEDGVRFRSHIDGSEHALTPESAVEIQARLGADIAMSFDECPAFPLTLEQARRSMARTLRWARRSRERFLQLNDGSGPGGRDVSLTNPGQAQFGVVQGSTFAELRQESAASTVAMGFDGYAIGGLSVGEPVELMYAMTEQTARLLPEDRLRHLMGAGRPDDLVEAVARGIDLFDCVLPTRNARNGQLFTRTGPLSIKLARYADDRQPPDPECRCYTCRQFSRAYLRHLYLAGEMTAATLNTLHNLHFYLDTMRRIRDALVFGTFEAFRKAFHQTFSRRPQG